MYYFNIKLQYLFLLVRGNGVIKKHNVKWTALFCYFYKGQGTAKEQTDGFKKEKRVEIEQREKIVKVNVLTYLMQLIKTT